jgi:hypothetical protein
MSGLSMLESMLSPHLKNNGASDTDIGFTFLSGAASFILGNIIFGQVNEFSIHHRNNLKELFVLENESSYN